MAVPDAEAEIFPGFLVIVHEPEDGSPLIATLPVETEHVGGVIVPVTGAVGATGGEFITTFPEAGELQPKELVTINV